MRRGQPVAALGLLLASATAAWAAGGPSLAPGKITDRVACAKSPDQTYALYLPSTYTPERKWPVLYVLDPRSRGALGAERFRAGAERFGYVVVSSNNSLSDGPDSPNIKAFQALWPDSHERLQLDDQRVYGAGFSGTVRSLCFLARAVPGLFAGIVGAGAGFPFGAPPVKSDRFAFFGAVGNRDFNYYEMLELEGQLRAAALAASIEIFDGGHAWPPEAVTARALAWFELQAMRSGTLPRDPAEVATLFSEQVARAAAAEAAARSPYDRVLAQRLWSAAVSDFVGLRDVGEALRRRIALDTDPAVQRELKEQAARRERDAAFIEPAPLILAGQRPGSGPNPPPAGARLTVEQALELLRVGELQKQAAESPSQDERLSAQRILNSLRVFAGGYMPQQFFERKQDAQALFVLRIASVLDPQDAGVAYNRGVAHARLGDPKNAIAELRRSVALGWKDGAAMSRDPDLASLRREPDFQALVRSLSAPR